MVLHAKAVAEVYEIEESGTDAAATTGSTAESKTEEVQVSNLFFFCVCMRMTTWIELNACVS